MTHPIIQAVADHRFQVAPVGHSSSTAFLAGLICGGMCQHAHQTEPALPVLSPLRDHRRTHQVLGSPTAPESLLLLVGAGDSFATQICLQRSLKSSETPAVSAEALLQGLQFNTASQLLVSTKRSTSSQLIHKGFSTLLTCRRGPAPTERLQYFF